MTTPQTNGRPADRGPAYGGQLSTANKYRLWAAVIILMAGYLLIRFGVGLYTNYLWFQHLAFESVFVTTIWARILVGLAVGLPFAILFWANAFIARWQSIRNVLFFSDETLVAQPLVAWSIWLAGAFLGWAAGTAASSNWLMFLRYLNQKTFALNDPIFEMDVGFYIFSLPFLHFIQSWLLVSLIGSVIAAVAVYALAQQNNLAEGRVVVLPHVQLHFSILGAFIFFTFALGHWLDLFDLMYSPRGVAFGASYTDVNITMPALWTMIIVASFTGIILLANTLLRRPALSLLAIFVWIIVGIIGTGFIPGIVQRYVVEPNELAREAPFIENNIRLTSIAYGLDKIQERDFSEIEPLTQETVAANLNFLKNIRLWDYRPLQQTYQQIQAIRLYYRFNDIDFDRYMIDGELRQIAIAARELDKSQLQSPTWVTQKLQFTHGYGVVMNPVNEVTKEGLPLLWLKDLPPVSDVGLTITQPEIYYGESNGDYIFVNTTEREFNYPSGEQNVYTSYSGSGGVVLDSIIKRLAFAVRLADTNMLLSQEFTPQSRILFYRNIGERVQRVAPFLQYDNDPYLMIGREDGRLYWIQDAYTSSNLFPYAEPIGNINYIRNSVKVVIDAYNGSMTFFMADPNDPLVQSYNAIFPELFTPIEEMPDWIRAQLRYPEDMFRIQSQLYQTYHMRDVNVFYNKEDLWQVPQENFSGNTQPVEPYYVIIKLPGEENNEFALIQPFTPNNKDNLIGWLAARSDGDKYGQLVTYRFPKQELIFGPLQIEGRIDQNPEISAQITLWDQGGSEVIRGNLLVLPIDDSLLYVEPLYLRAENGQIPELKRVIIASGDTIVMRETLAEAFVAFFEEEEGELLPEMTRALQEVGGGELVLSQPSSAAEPAESASSDPTVTAPIRDLSDKAVQELAQLAADHYETAQAALKNGDWATYGKELDELERTLQRLLEITQQP